MCGLTVSTFVIDCASTARLFVGPNILTLLDQVFQRSIYHSLLPVCGFTSLLLDGTSVFNASSTPELAGGSPSTSRL